MSYYDNEQEYQSRGMDYDLVACLDYNPQSFSADDIERVLAVWEGENDSDDWRWVLLLKDGRYAFLQGGCDYTGWDCRSWATHEFADSAEAAAELALGDFSTVRDNLLKQIQEGKARTWRENKDDEFGLSN